jgi:hypothetical protein
MEDARRRALMSDVEDCCFECGELSSDEAGEERLTRSFNVQSCLRLKDQAR